MSYYDEICEIAADFERSESDWGEEYAGQPIRVGDVWVDSGSPVYGTLDGYYSRRADRYLNEMLDCARELAS